MIENVLAWFDELKDNLEMYQFNTLQNATPIQWPLIIKLIKQCEVNENNIQMFSKKIDVIRKMMFQYNGIIEKQNAELAKLEINSQADSDSNQLNKSNKIR